MSGISLFSRKPWLWTGSGYPQHRHEYMWFPFCEASQNIYCTKWNLVRSELETWSFRCVTQLQKTCAIGCSWMYRVVLKELWVECEWHWILWLLKTTVCASRLQCVCDNNIAVTNTDFVQHLKVQKIYALPVLHKLQVKMRICTYLWITLYNSSFYVNYNRLYWWSSSLTFRSWPNLSYSSSTK